MSVRIGNGDIERVFIPLKHQDQEIPRVLESSQETKLSRNDQVNTFPLYWLENQDKPRNDDQNKKSCLDETLFETMRNNR